MDNSGQLLIIEVVSSAVQLDFQRLPYGMASEIILLEEEGLGDIHDSRGQEGGKPLSQIEEKDLIHRTRVSEHSFQSLLRHLHYLLQGLVQLDLRQLMRVLYHLKGLCRPLLVQNRHRPNLVDFLLRHMLHVFRSFRKSFRHGGRGLAPEGSPRNLKHFHG